jgi:hypothetical protein
MVAQRDSNQLKDRELPTGDKLNGSQEAKMEILAYTVTMSPSPPEEGK